MKKTFYLLLFVLMLSATAKAQSTWTTKNLDENLSVKFPAEPEKVSKPGVDSYTVKAKDSVIYIAGVVDYKIVAGLDSATLASMKDMQQFADQIRIGMSSRKPNYTFGPITIGKWKTYTLYNVSATENANKYTLTGQLILIGSKMYSFSCRVPVNQATPDKEVFLGSVELLKK
jgi:hypothetical protein